MTLAALGVVVAHLAATSEPDERYLVAVTDLPAGALLADPSAVRDGFRAVAVDLPTELAGAAIPADLAADVVGRRLTGPVTAGDLLLASALTGVGEEPGVTAFSFAAPIESAVGGALAPGDRIDVLATVGSGADATTSYVVRAAPVTDVGASDAGLGGSSLLLTVALDEVVEVQALAHALATSTVVVVRSPDDSDVVPGPYRSGDVAAATPPTDPGPDLGPDSAPEADPGPDPETGPDPEADPGADPDADAEGDA